MAIRETTAVLILAGMLVSNVAWAADSSRYAPTAPGNANVLIPARGVASSVPASRWDYGFLTGNGRIGAIVYGNPTRETIVLNHERLYLPHPRPEICDLGKYLPEVRRIIREKGHVAALKFSLEKAAEQGHFNYHSDPFHLAFELNLEMPAGGTVTDYVRTTDFQTGEVSVRWRDDDGGYARRLFVSRPDNVAVLSITRSGAQRIDATIVTPPIKHELVESELRVDQNWITYHNAYTQSPGGYDSVVRVVVKEGRIRNDGHKIIVTDASEVLLLMGVEWHERLEADSVEILKLKEKLLALPVDYQKLLRPHAAAHGRIFNRTTLDLGGGDDRQQTTEKLLKDARATDYRRIPPALIEKMYDASRFYFICSAGELPPNLQGIWNGVFTAPWNGSYTFDTNVQNAMDSALSANMLEGMEGYFRLIESFLPDWRTNAEKLFGARGIVSQVVASPNSGLNSHYGGNWAWQFWTPGAGWLASYFYDYYRYTGDQTFLADRAIPLMKEIAVFYEDFLIEQDANGFILYRPSYSPEVGGLLASDNSTMDLAVARELLTNLINACEELNVEQEHIGTWRTLLQRLPPYQIGPNGDLSEWADGSFRHAYDHRHHSPFYPLFRSFEFSPKATPELWEAAKTALAKKGEQWLRNPRADWAGIPFGRSFHAQSAAFLGQGEVVEEILNSMADRVYPSLHMSLRPNGGIFNFDGNGAYPDIVNRSLAFSLKGTLDLLRSIPPGWRRGSIRGILARGRITIDHLQWDQDKGVIHLELTSAVKQEVTLRLPGRMDALKVVRGSAETGTSSHGTGARKLTLPAQEQIGLEIRTEPTVYKPKAFKTERRIITPNTLPLRLGADSNGRHTFVGDMARASIFNRVLPRNEIASLATDDCVSPETVKGCVASWDFERKDGAVFLSRGSGKAFLARPVGTVTEIDTKTPLSGRDKCLHRGTDEKGRILLNPSVADRAFVSKHCLGKAVHLEGGAYLRVDHDPELNCQDGLTLEAWIRPGRMSGAGMRIIDKTPAGEATAYLLDTHPANSLRLIFHYDTLTHQAGLVPDQWVHVAATVNGETGEAILYVDGKPVKRRF
ncbi:MAG: glycoside hydrolase N-terminal domain-containing protein [Planctomycetes bacterium]|nr:glycoside hydrolase N-terminal domain-containing protein [Planctomycetota bacterium]